MLIGNNLPQTDELKSAKKKKKPKASSEVPLQNTSDKFTAGSQSEKEVTFLAYLDGCNNLQRFITQNLKDMERVDAQNMNIVAQLGRFEIPPLTQNFFGEALSQVITNPEFGKVLVQQTGDPEGVAQFQEMFKDKNVAGYISETVLSSSPALMESMNQLTQSLAGQVLADKDMGEMFVGLAGQLASQMLSDSDEVTGDVTLSAKNDTQDINKISKQMLNGISRFISVKMKGGIVFVNGGPSTAGRATKSEHKTAANTEPEWTGVRRYVVKYGDDAGKINSKVVEELPDANMGISQTAEDFFKWGIKEYPAKKYVFLMSDHGAGFLGGFEDKGEMMKMNDISAMAGKVKKDTGADIAAIIDDCCLMSQIEVAKSMKDSGLDDTIFIASAETVGGQGMPYVKMLERIDELAGKKEATGLNIGKAIVEECAKTAEESTTTVAALNLGKADTVVSAVDNLSKAMMASGEKDAIKSVFNNTLFYSQSSPSTPYRDFRDLGHLADNLVKSKEISSPEIKKAAAEVKKSLEVGDNNFIVAEEHVGSVEEYEPASGISIYAPKSSTYISGKVYDQYKGLSMSEDHSWDEMLEWLTDVQKKLEKEKAEGADKKPSFIKLPQRT